MNKQNNTPNPSALGLTKPEARAYNFILRRESEGQVTTTGNIAASFGLNRTTVYKTLKSLVDKGILETYERGYYRTCELN